MKQFPDNNAGQKSINRLASFLFEWSRNPIGVAAIAPSGRKLAGLITSEIGPSNGKVIELGPGTGAFTRALLAREVQPRDLTLIELNKRFARQLQDDFPSIDVINASAEILAKYNILGGKTAGAIVSGLGLLTMSRETVWTIMSGVERHLATGACFYQFTYTRRCPIPDDIVAGLGMKAEPLGKIMLNLPPATVYRIYRRFDEELIHGAK